MYKLALPPCYQSPGPPQQVPEDPGLCTYVACCALYIVTKFPFHPHGCGSLNDARKMKEPKNEFLSPASVHPEKTARF